MCGFCLLWKENTQNCFKKKQQQQQQKQKQVNPIGYGDLFYFSLQEKKTFNK
jgi:hypothetical protein